MLYLPNIQHLISEQENQVDVLRLDEIDKEISGNKWFKLKYNIASAQKLGLQHLITFGGAYSNHIAATAAACKKEKLTCTGIIRGEEPFPLNATLAKAKDDGMKLHFVSREEYDKKTTTAFQKHLETLFGPHYIVPEGGNNDVGILGCTEIIHSNWDYDYICCPCGTAATYTGILGASIANQKIIGISVLKGENSLVKDVNLNLQKLFPHKKIVVKGNEALQEKEIQDHCIINTYAFNGYAKFNPELLSFKQKFESEYKIILDHVYTAKLFYAVFDLLTKKQFKKGSRILIIHTGGLQGNAGFEARYHLIPSL